MFTASSCIYNIGEDESMPARDPAGVKMTRGLLHDMRKGVSVVEINSIAKKSQIIKKELQLEVLFLHDIHQRLCK